MRNLSSFFLREIVRYDFSSGEFRWIVRPENHFKSSRSHKIWNTKNSGNVIRNPDSAGYLYLNLAGKRYPLHRLAWLYHYGLDASIIDHINGVKCDNKISNLRVANSTENNRNKSINKKSKSGFKGVWFCNTRGKWVSSIRTGHSRIHIGSFYCKIEAAKAYDIEAIKYHGEFALTNKMMGLL